MTEYLWVLAGSALGGAARYWLASEVSRAYGPGFPWGTLTVNVLGGLAIGCASAFIDSPRVRLFVMVGLCGGFTTFSSFSLEMLTLLRSGAAAKCAAYAAASVVLCLGSVWLGSMIGRALPGGH